MPKNANCYLLILSALFGAFLFGCVALAQQDPEPVILLPAASPPNEAEIARHIRDLYGGSENKLCHPELVEAQTRASSLYLREPTNLTSGFSVRADPSKYILSSNLESKTENYAFLIEPSHKCWKTYVYLFQIQIDEKDLSYFKPVNLEEFERIEKSRNRPMVTLTTDWVVSPEIKKEMPSFFWVLSNSSSDLGSLLQEQNLMPQFRGSGPPAESWSEVGLVQFADSKAALFYTKLPYIDEKRALPIVAQQIREWLSDIEYRPGKLNQKKSISVNWLSDIVTGPTPAVRESSLGKALYLGMQVEEEKRSTQLWHTI